MFLHSIRIVRSRHPLARLLLGVVALLVAAMLVTIGFFALVALVVGGSLFMLVRALRSATSPSAAAPASAPPPGIIEGEFTVLADEPLRETGAPRGPAPAAR